MRLLSRLRVSVAVAVGEADEKLVEPKPNLCGHVLEIILFPQQSTNLSEDEFTKEATSVFKRRTDLEWNDFDQFKNDSKNFAFVEVVYRTGDEKGDFFCACSCKIKGKACDHIISAYFLKKNLVKPSEEPSISRFAKSKGRLPNARKQIRY